jgi:hypothetical protein
MCENAYLTNMKKWNGYAQKFENFQYHFCKFYKVLDDIRLTNQFH